MNIMNDLEHPVDTVKNAAHEVVQEVENLAAKVKEHFASNNPKQALLAVVDRVEALEKKVGLLFDQAVRSAKE
jgi:hypothetical protein